MVIGSAKSHLLSRNMLLTYEDLQSSRLFPLFLVEHKRLLKVVGTFKDHFGQAWMGHLNRPCATIIPKCVELSLLITSRRLQNSI